MVSALVSEFANVLRLLQNHHIIEGFTLDVCANQPLTPSIAAFLDALFTIVRDYRERLEDILCNRGVEIRQIIPQLVKVKGEEQEHCQERIDSTFVNNAPLRPHGFDPLPVGLSTLPECLEAVNLSVSNSLDTMEAVNLSVAPIPYLEALNLSVATSPACLNLSVATSPCFNTVDANVGTSTDSLKTLLDVGTSTEWEPGNLDVPSSAGYFPSGNVGTSADAVSFTHDCDSDILDISASVSDALNFDLDREMGAELPSKISAAESVALSVLEELPQLPAALDLSQGGHNLLVSLENEESIEKSISPSPSIEYDQMVVQGPPYPCNWCDKTFTVRSRARRHAATHGEGRYLCHHCGKACAEAWQLERHEATHVGGSFECKECGQRCVDGVKLRRHLATHVAGNHTCAVCRRSFSRPDTLKRHMDIRHRQERPFECSICGRTFSVKCNLDGHVNSVHGGQSVECSICGKKSKNGATLRAHMKTHTAPAFSCEICNRAFHRLVQYRRHMVNHHKTN